MSRTIPADNFVAMLVANVDNAKLDDKAFREFVRSTLTAVQGADYNGQKRADGWAYTDDGAWPNQR